MNRALIVVAAALLAALALWHPAAAPRPVSVTAPPPFMHPHAGHSRRIAPPAAIVYLAGAVVHPGLYALTDTARVDDAIRRAGGLRADADRDAVNLAEHITDGEEIRVPRIGEATPRPARTRSKRKKRVAPPTSIDINTADAAALSSLPGLGATLAERIVRFRDVNGPFASIDELADVAGMTQKRVDAIVPYVTLHEAR
jgi:competence protein ComEA